MPIAISGDRWRPCSWCGPTGVVARPWWTSTGAVPNRCFRGCEPPESALRRGAPEASFAGQRFGDSNAVTAVVVRHGGGQRLPDILRYMRSGRCAGGQGCDSVKRWRRHDLPHRPNTVGGAQIRALAGAYEGVNRPIGGGENGDASEPVALKVGPSRLMRISLKTSPISCCSLCRRRPDHS